MKKNKNILEKVESYKYKRGISFATAQGTLYKTFKIIATVAFVWFLVFNLLYILSGFLNLSDVNTNEIKENLISIMCCTALLSFGFILNCTKLHLIGSLIIPLPLIYNILIFYQMISSVSNNSDVIDASNYILNMPPLFYYRHLIPAFLLLICCIVMAIIDIRANIKNNKLYDHIASCLYKEQFSADADLSEEEWSKLIENSDKQNYSQQFSENN